MRKILLLALANLLTLGYAKTYLGVSTSAYQIEGAWDKDGRTPSIWDTFSHTPGKIKDGTNGDIASDHYHHWEKDIEWVQWLGANVYRFSLSWTRILPTGRPDVINHKGVEFYNSIINTLLAKNITPFVTLSHWDTPQSLHDEYGSWTSNKMIDDFVNYADVCFQLFGDRVKYWLTLNEIQTYCNLGYGNGNHAPGLTISNPYEVAHRSLLAHAKTYHLYHEKYATEQKGFISIALNSDFVQPQNPYNPEDIKAAQRGILWRIGLYSDPLFFGDYPKEIKDRCGNRLPQFKQEDRIQNTLDFFSLNHYTTLEATSRYNQDYNLFNDPQISERFPSGCTSSAASWLCAYPNGIYGMIKWLQDRYNLVGNNMSLVITESGVATTPSESGIDALRVQYLDGYIKKALQARDDLGINLIVYCVWSLYDNFEWSSGYLERYGLINIDFSSPNRTRTPKDSAQWLRTQTFFDK